VAGSSLVPSFSQRGIFSAAGQQPDGTLAAMLLERCRESAIGRGINFEVPYEPWINVDLMQTLLIDMHEAYGCSWSVALVMTVLAIRIVTIPIQISALKGARSRALLQPEMNRLMAARNAATAPADINRTTKDLQAFNNKHGRFFMLRGVWNLLLFQVPLYLTAYAATRGLANYPDLYTGFALEAPLWLESLALPDPYAILPIAVSAVMLTNVELFGSVDTEMQQVQPTIQQQESNPQVAGQATVAKYQKWVMRGGALVLIPLTWNFPSSTFIFMLTNITMATTQNRLLRTPTMERLLEIPPPPESKEAKAGEKSLQRQPLVLPLDKTDKLPGPTVRHQTSTKSLPTVRPEIHQLLSESAQQILQLTPGKQLLLEPPKQSLLEPPKATSKSDESGSSLPLEMPSLVSILDDKGRGRSPRRPASDAARRILEQQQSGAVA